MKKGQADLIQERLVMPGRRALMEVSTMMNMHAWDTDMNSPLLNQSQSYLYQELLMKSEALRVRSGQLMTMDMLVSTATTRNNAVSKLMNEVNRLRTKYADLKIPYPGSLAYYSAAMFQHHVPWPMQDDGGSKAGLLLLALYGYPSTTEITCGEVPHMYFEVWETAVKERQKEEEPSSSRIS